MVLSRGGRKTAPTTHRSLISLKALGDVESLESLLLFGSYRMQRHIDFMANLLKKLERAMGFEPTTPTLARLRSRLPESSKSRW
jgi:hypothetical protein